MADFFKEISDRRVLPAVGVYVASVWVLIEILDRLVDRYLLSPYLTDVFFWGLYSLIPAVMLIAWTHGKPGKDKTTRLEKVGVSINVIATIGLLATVIGAKDLSLAATEMTFSNELGQQETHYITAETFRRRMAVFFWKNESGNPDLDWLQYGITELLVQDLQQDPFVLASSPWNNFSDGFYSRMQQAGFKDGLNVPRSLMRKITDKANRQYFVDGSLDQVDGEYLVTARIWETQTLEQVAELSLSGWDLYAVVDDLSKEVRKALDVPESSSRIAEDLPLVETYGESDEALKAYISGMNARLFDNDFELSSSYFDEAIRIDPNFVLAWFLKASNMLESGDIPGAQEALSKAQELDYRLPSRDRAQLKIMLYSLAGESEKLMSFLRLQTKIYDDSSSHDRLANMHTISGDLEDAKAELLLALDRDALNVGIYLRMSALERATGDMEAAIDYAKIYQQQKPEDIKAHIQLGDLLRDSGQLVVAEEHYKEALILQNAPVKPAMKLAIIAARKGDINAARAYLSEADGFASSPAEKALVLQGAAALELRLGRIGEAIKHTYAQEEFLSQSSGLLDLTLSVYFPLISLQVALEDYEAAEDALIIAKGRLSPPMDKFLSFSEAYIHVKTNDIPAARASLQKAHEVIEQFQIKYLNAQVHIIEGAISEANGDYAAMTEHYLAVIAQIQRTVIGVDIYKAVPQIYSELAKAQIAAGELVGAEKSLSAGFMLDQSEPALWLSKARLQKAQNMPQLALASVNYALAIWKDADAAYGLANEARALSTELQSLSQ
jgi:tetratricopeptide (TPR) repeat protein